MIVFIIMWRFFFMLKILKLMFFFCADKLILNVQRYGYPMFQVDAVEFFRGRFDGGPVTAEVTLNITSL